MTESFAYGGEGAPLMKRAVNRRRVEERGSQTLVTTSVEVELKGGSFGRLLRRRREAHGLEILAGLK